jgi:hypothetical protein
MGGDVQIKGSGIGTGLRWIAKNFGDVTVTKLIDALPAELREPARRILPSSWYPIALLEGLYWELPRLTGRGDRAAKAELIKALNAHVAEENLTTFYKALLLVMTSSRLFDMLPRLFGTYFKGIEVTIQRESPKKGTCKVHGLGTVPYMAPAAIGWLTFAYRKVGSTAKITEENWDRGADKGNPLVFHLEWT